MQVIMAIKCFGCGNFISPDIPSCPICGETKEIDTSSFETGTPLAQGEVYDMWDYFWQAGNERSAMSRHEAILLRILVGIIILMLAITLFATP